jgi:DNA-binding XRE family transcriptional regulator
LENYFDKEDDPRKDDLSLKIMTKNQKDEKEKNMSEKIGNVRKMVKKIEENDDNPRWKTPRKSPLLNSQENTPPRIKRGGGMIVKKKKGNSTPKGNEIERKREFFKTQLKVKIKKFEDGRGTDNLLTSKTNPNLILARVLGPADISQWEGPYQTGPRDLDKPGEMQQVDWPLGVVDGGEDQ